MFRKKKGLRSPAKHKKRLVWYIDAEKPIRYVLLNCWSSILAIAIAVGYVIYLHLNQKTSNADIGSLDYVKAYLVIILTLVTFWNRYMTFSRHYMKVKQILMKK